MNEYITYIYVFDKMRKLSSWLLSNVKGQFIFMESKVRTN